MKPRNFLMAAAVFAFGVGLLVWPEEVMAAGRESLTLCANVIIPSLFPFFVLSSLVIGLGYAAALGKLLHRVMPLLFGVGGSCAAALVLGLVGGYPVGAKTAAQLYQNRLCSKAEAERMLGFCNNAGPAFLLGVVGVGLFGSVRMGILLWITHILSALLVGLLMRFQGGCLTTANKTAPIPKPLPAAQVFADSVKGSVTTLLHVCAFIVLFGVLLRLGQCAGLLSLGNLWTQRLLCGFVELSNGVAMLPADDPLRSVPMAAFFLGWGGLSVLCQTMSVIQDAGLSIIPCVLGKLLHGLFSALISSLLLRLLPANLEAYAPFQSPMFYNYVNYPWQTTAFSCLLAAALLVCFCCMGKKWGGNRRKGRL